MDLHVRWHLMATLCSYCTLVMFVALTAVTVRIQNSGSCSYAGVSTNKDIEPATHVPTPVPRSRILILGAGC
jgi:hypothetical protein